MRTLSFIILLFCLNARGYAQDILSMKPDTAINGIKIHKLASDEHSTSFIIWVEKEVKSHKHAFHTEHIYILEGEGSMKLNGEIREIKPGYYFNIPQNTVHSLKVSSQTPIKVLSIQTPEFTGEDRIPVD